MSPSLVSATSWLGPQFVWPKKIAVLFVDLLLGCLLRCLVVWLSGCLAAWLVACLIDQRITYGVAGLVVVWFGWLDRVPICHTSGPNLTGGAPSIAEDVWCSRITGAPNTRIPSAGLVVFMQPIPCSQSSETSVQLPNIGFGPACTQILNSVEAVWMGAASREKLCQLSMQLRLPGFSCRTKMQEDKIARVRRVTVPCNRRTTQQQKQQTAENKTLPQRNPNKQLPLPHKPL